jgi:hypothetical protein
MANIDDYNAKLDVIKAIPDEDVQTPAIPVDAFLQEGENLKHWSTEDAARLAVVGITQEMIDDLSVRTGALREAQSIWMKDRYSMEEAQREWNLLSPEAYDLRDELIHDYRFAYRKDPVLLGRVSAIADGTGDDDMIQDLNDLSVLGKANPEPLNAIGFDATKLDTASTKSDEMAELLATANGDKAEQNESKLIRDKAYTHLKELVDEIREAGKYVFWKDEIRYRGYTSEYWRKRNRNKSDDEPEVTEQ